MSDNVSNYSAEPATPHAPVETPYRPTYQAGQDAIAKASEAAAGLNMAVPEAVRALAEKTVTQSREAYEKAKDSMEAAVETLEKSLDKAGQGAQAINRKVIDIAQKNLNSSFDLAKELAGAKNMAELVELQAAYARKHFETLMGQAEEIRTLSAKVANESAEPFKAHVTRSMESFKRVS